MPWIKIEGPAYWTVFVTAFLAVAVWESFRPRRALNSPAELRWTRHGILLTVSAVLLTAVVRLTPVVAAAAARPWGVLNQAWMPFTVRCIAAILLLDLVHYATHWTFHHVPLLWRVHEVHHSDPEYDVSTAGRFHPIEVIATQGAYLAAIVLLALPLIAVLISELLTVVLNFFAHANASLPGWAERLLRNVIVTPDFHRIHHSEDVWEQTRNLGQTFIWWDRLFGTFVANPRAGQEGIVTGITGLQNRASLGLRFMLAEPFHNRAATAANRASEAVD
jgi:sterol desaturase/sphingolipid hydroxylase (fatty acid hydroxylase superfamily)